MSSDFGITSIDELLRSMKPELADGEYVFCTVTPGSWGELGRHMELEPVCTFAEREGLTLVVSRSKAESAGLEFEGVFRQITLTVHSSLQAVGLTAAVASKLAEEGISANVIAAYYHDHIFVPSRKAERAMSALKELSKSVGVTV